MFGFGQNGTAYYAGWVIKMWGTKSSSVGVRDCTGYTRINGYVTMDVGAGVNLTTASNCALTSNAKVQWAFSSYYETNGLTTADQRNSFIYLGGAEESLCGGTDLTAACGTAHEKPIYFAAGGAVGKDTWAGYGLGSYRIFASSIDYDGLTLTTNATGFNTHSNVISTSTYNAVGTGEEALGLNSNTAFQGEPAGSMTNACWTVVQPYIDATNSIRTQFAGYTGSPHHCVDFAIDGFSVMGVPMVYQVAADISNGLIKPATTTGAAVRL